MSTVEIPEQSQNTVLSRLGAISLPVQRLILLIGCALLFCAWFSRMPLVEVDETRYVTASRNMLERHEFIIPWYNGHPRYEKPVLIYWIQTSFMRVLGRNEFAARLPSGLAGILLVLLVHGFLLRWLPRRFPGEQATVRGVAFLGGVALATLPLVALYTRAGVTDVTLTLFMSLAMLSLLEADLARRQGDDHAGRARWWYLLAAAGCGLAFLTKGPIAILVPGLTWLVYHLRQGTLGAEARRVPWLPAILLLLLIAVPWYAATYFRDGGAFLKQFFFTENVKRFAGEVKEPENLVIEIIERIGSVIAFLLAILLFLYPYGAFLLHELTVRFRGTPVATDPVLSAMRRFAWTWLVVAVGFITFSKLQYPNYVQNIAAAVILLFALYLCETRQAARMGAFPRVLLVVFGVLWLLLIEVVLWPEKPHAIAKLLGKYGPRAWSLPYPAHLPEILMVITGVAGVVMLGYILLQRRPFTLITGVIGSWTIVIAITMLGAATLLYQSLFGASVQVGHALADPSLCPPDLAVVAYYPRRDPPEDMVYYSHREITFYIQVMRNRVSLKLLNDMLASHGRLLLVTDDTGLRLTQRLGTVTVIRRVNYFSIARLERSTHDNHVPGNL